MGKGMIMGSGGGGGDLYACIGVLCKSTDTVTCQNDYGEALTPQAGSTQHVFKIPEAGTWTVAAGDRSKNIVISSAGQCEKVQLAKIYLLQGTSYGDVNWTATASSTYMNTAAQMAAPNVQQTSNGSKLSLTSSSGYKYGTFNTATKFNLTPYSTLHFDLKETNITFTGGPYDIRVNIANAVTGYYNTDLVYQYNREVVTGGSYSDQINLSTITGEFYIAFEIKARAGTSSFYVDNVYLE